MDHPQLNGHGDPGNWASVTPTNNIEYPAIEAANNILPTIFEACIMDATGVYAYQRVTLQSGPNAMEVIDDPQAAPTLIALGTALDNTECNASKMAFVGRFTGGGFQGPDYLLGPAYNALLAAMASGDLNQLQAWFNLHYAGPGANFQDFLRPLNLTAIVQQAEANVLQAAVSKLPKI